MNNTSSDRVWHEGRQWVNVGVAATIASMSQAAVYKAIYEKRLDSVELLGVTAIAVDSIEKLWPVK